MSYLSLAVTVGAAALLVGLLSWRRPMEDALVRGLLQVGSLVSLLGVGIAVVVGAVFSRSDAAERLTLLVGFGLVIFLLVTFGLLQWGLRLGVGQAKGQVVP